MSKRHIAASGAKKGQWVQCDAANCRLKNSPHITEKQFYSVSAWLNRMSFSPTLLKDITEEDVETFSRIPWGEDDERFFDEKSDALLRKATKGRQVEKNSLDNHSAFKSNFPFEEFAEKMGYSKSNYDADYYDDEESEAGYDDYEDYEDDYHHEDEYYEKLALANELERGKDPEELRVSRIVAQAKRDSVRGLGSEGGLLFDRDVTFTLEDFEAHKLQAIENGGDLRFSEATLLEYSDGRPSEIEIKGLKIIGSEDDVSAFKLVASKNYTNSKDILNVSFQMKKKDYEKFLQDVSQNPNVKIYPQELKVTRNILGRELVSGSFDIQGSVEDMRKVWDPLKSQKQVREIGWSKALVPRSTKYQELAIDDSARKSLHSVYSNLKVASSGSTDRLTLEEQHFIDRARTKYIPELVSDYSKLQGDPSVSKEDKDEAANLFRQQLELVSRKTDLIKEKQSSSRLNSMHVNLDFLAAKLNTSLGSSGDLG